MYPLVVLCAMAVKDSFNDARLETLSSMFAFADQFESTPPIDVVLLLPLQLLDLLGG